MKKRILSILLMLSLVVCLLPALAWEADAATSSVRVGGVEMTDGTYLASGATETTTTKPTNNYAYYKDGVLTIHNFNNQGGCYNECAVYIAKNLTLVLEGSNTLSCDETGVVVAGGSLTVRGSGSVAITAGRTGIHAENDITIIGGTVTVDALTGLETADGDITVSGGNIKLTAREYGMYAYDELTIKGGTVNVNSLDDGIVAWENIYVAGGTLTVDANTTALFADNGNIEISGGNLTARSTNTSYDDGCCAIFVRKGDLYIAFTMSAMASTEPNGTLSTFDPAKLSSYDLVVVKTELDAPTLKASNISSTGKIKLTWDKVDGAAKYEVYRATSKTGTYSLLKTVTGTSLNNTSAEVGKTYYYKVRAVDANGNKSGWSNIVSRTCDLPQVTGLSASNVASTGKIKLTWNKVAGASKYEVYRATSKTGTYTKLTTVTGTSVTNTSATVGKTYYYKIKAIHSTSSANAADSSVVSRTCDLPRPVAKVALNSSGKPVITWEKVSGAAKYTVYIYNADGEQLKTANASGVKLTHSSAVKNTTYKYRVVAVHSSTAANSAKSTAVSIKSK